MNIRNLLALTAVSIVACNLSSPSINATAPKPEQAQKQVVKVIKTPVGEWNQLADGQIVYNWDKFYEGNAYKEAAPGEEITDQLVATIGGKPSLVRVQVNKKDTVEASKATQRQAV